MSRRVIPPLIGQPPRFNRRRFAVVIVTALLLPLLAGLFLLQRWANAPLEKTTTITRGPTADTPAPLQAVKTSQYSFTVPASFRVRSTTDMDNRYLTHAQVFETGQLGRQVAVTTNLLPADGLAGVADYHLRQTATDKYQLYDPGGLPAGSQAFGNIADRELTLFMVNGNRYASVSVSGVGGNGRLRELFKQVYSSWQWQ